MTPIAYFISSHGYGHATRASAVMLAIAKLKPNIRFELFTTTPRWLFEESHLPPFGYHHVLSDIGVVQRDSLTEDLPATWHKLQEFLPFNEAKLNPLVEQVNRLNCHMVMCDISPLGIAVAKAAKLPAVLIENFTWDWIYEGYLTSEPRLQPYVAYLRDLFASADMHIQTEPICQPQAVDLTTRPVSRPVRTPAPQIRQQLAILPSAKVVMITMGGVPWTPTFVAQLAAQTDIFFLIPGQEPLRQGNIIQTGQDSSFFHPDLINASDVVVGKAGYSTLSEVHQVGLPFGYIARPRFRESPALVEFISHNMPGLPITDTQFADGRWLNLLPDLLALPRRQPESLNGADQIAAKILDFGF